MPLAKYVPPSVVIAKLSAISVSIQPASTPARALSIGAFQRALSVCVFALLATAFSVLASSSIAFLFGSIYFLTGVNISLVRDGVKRKMQREIKSRPAEAATWFDNFCGK